MGFPGRLAVLDVPLAGAVEQPPGLLLRGSSPAPGGGRRSGREEPSPPAAEVDDGSAAVAVLVEHAWPASPRQRRPCAARTPGPRPRRRKGPRRRRRRCPRRRRWRRGPAARPRPGSRSGSLLLRRRRLRAPPPGLTKAPSPAKAFFSAGTCGVGSPRIERDFGVEVGRLRVEVQEVLGGVLADAEVADGARGAAAGGAHALFKL